MANFFDQFDQQAAPQQAGANFFDQFHTPAAPSSTDVPGQISIPGLGKPSLIGMVKGLYEGGKSALTLPGDVYAGRVDPMSDEGIKRAVDMAAMTALPSAGRTLAAPAAETTTIGELKAAATPTYQELTKAGNVVPVAGKDISQGIAAELHPQALRPASAPRTYSELNNLSRGKDLNDIAIARDNLRDIANGIAENKLIRVTGPDSTAARNAMNSLDARIEELSPGWTGQMATADANWAAALRAGKVLKEAEKGAKGRLGSFDTNEARAKGFTPEEIAAVKRAHQGGTLGTALNAMGALSPFHGGVTGAVSAAMHLPAAIVSHGASLAGMPVGIAADLAAKALRQRALNAAVEKIISRSPLAQSRVRTPVGLPPLRIPPPTLGLLPYANRPQDQ